MHSEQNIAGVICRTGGGPIKFDGREPPGRYSWQVHHRIALRTRYSQPKTHALFLLLLPLLLLLLLLILILLVLLLLLLLQYKLKLTNEDVGSLLVKPCQTHTPGHMPSLVLKLFRLQNKDQPGKIRRRIWIDQSTDRISLSFPTRLTRSEELTVADDILGMALSVLRPLSTFLQAQMALLLPMMVHTRPGRGRGGLKQLECFLPLPNLLTGTDHCSVAESCHLTVHVGHALGISNYQ